MFDDIAPSYDFLNRFLSLSIDTVWRKKSLKTLKKKHKIIAPKVLDVAAGTGDFAFDSNKILKAKEIVCYDVSKNMLDVAIKKAKNKKLNCSFSTIVGKAEKMPFQNETFDLITVAFGVRNFVNLEQGLSEMNRVLKKNGLLVILEFSKTEYFIIKQMYDVYLNYCIPYLGKLFSKNFSAYKYLGQSIETFPYGQEFIDILKNNGFKNTSTRRYSFGVSTAYLSQKK